MINVSTNHQTIESCIAQNQPLYHADIKAGVLGLDPRTHVVTFFFVAVCSLLITGYEETLFLQIVAAGYLSLNGKARLAAQSCISFAIISVLSFLPLAGLYGVMLVSFLHMVPPFTTGCALFTLSPSVIMCALDRWHMPKNVLVGVCMLFRFASVLTQESHLIVQGIRMRGIFASAWDVVKHPGFAYECFYTPIVMRCLRLSSELAAASELRGIDIDDGRTTIYHLGLRPIDGMAVLFLAMLCIGTYVLGMVM